MGGGADAATQVIEGGQSEAAGFDVTGATDMSAVDVDLSAIGEHNGEINSFWCHILYRIVIPPGLR